VVTAFDNQFNFTRNVDLDLIQPTLRQRAGGGLQPSDHERFVQGRIDSLAQTLKEEEIR
jgi:hypothetical protein